jgi:LysR family transcriptional regulator for bpeEF and oprC
MDRFAAMEAFVGVAQFRSFTRASESLDLPKTTISRLVRELEAGLGVRLLNRTTRHVSLTPEGVVFYDESVRLLDDLRQSEARITAGANRPHGRLRVDMAHSVANGIVIPALPQFAARYPEITLEITCSERIENLVADGTDCALRANIIQDETLIARELGALEVITCASPGYLRRRGTPVCPSEIANHQVIAFYFSKNRKLRDLQFETGGQRQQVAGKPVAAFSDVQACMTAALAGLGITQIPAFLLQEPLAAGGLTRILPDCGVDAIDMFAVYPQSRRHSAKVQAFVGWVAELFANLR